jgi:hypothetical protein
VLEDSDRQTEISATSFLASFLRRAPLETDVALAK